MKDDGERLGVVEFGRRLLETADLDPLYVILWDAKMKRGALCRWLVAYWCYYHAGLCCWIVDQPDFWIAMLTVAQGGKEYPRGTERRHFRGQLAVDSVKRLLDHAGTAEGLVDWLIDAGPTAAGVMKRVTELHGFGEWVKWKVPDMIERLGLAPLRFDAGDIDQMFTSSKQGAATVCETYGLKQGLLPAHRYLVRKLGRFRAPPALDRMIGVQETETIFCKWHSHLGGHYPIGKDTTEIHEGLCRYGGCVSTQKLLRAMRMGPLRA